MHFGVPRADAELAADVLAKSDLRGIDSHGVARLQTYFEMLELGRINPKPKIKIVRETPSTATVDGDNGLGLVVGPGERDRDGKAEQPARAGSASATRTTYGIAGYYVHEGGRARHDRLVDDQHDASWCVPLWGAERMLGTNPIAIAFPARQGAADRDRHGDQRGGLRQDRDRPARRRGQSPGLGHRHRRQPDHRPARR